MASETTIEAGPGSRWPIGVVVPTEKDAFLLWVAEGDPERFRHLKALDNAVLAIARAHGEAVARMAIDAILHTPPRPGADVVAPHQGEQLSEHHDRPPSV